jgi:two-component system sensor histidine kinase DesK
MFGVVQLARRNLELVAAREQNARLAIEEERSRMARDIHDILGHTLTAITVKAELAGRLIELAPDRARREVEELEQLSRTALADVRSTVAGYHALSLPGELARARSVLTAAGIEADLPNTTDHVADSLREVFAYGVREGITNVVRHSGARTCAVRLEPHRLEVCDDGDGPPSATAPGTGLTGLRERAARAGARLTAEPAASRGFRLVIEGVEA